MKRLNSIKEVDKTKKPGRPKNPKVTAKQDLYARTLVETGSKKKAMEVSGYSPTYNLDHNKKVQFAIQEYKKKMEIKFMDRAEELAENLYNLAMHANSEQVRLNASKDWLDRAGLAPVTKSEIETKKVISAESQISRELVDRLANLKQKKEDEG